MLRSAVLEECKVDGCREEELKRKREEKTVLCIASKCWLLGKRHMRVKEEEGEVELMVRKNAKVCIFEEGTSRVVIVLV
jgi:protein associated with RNAse G/E